MAEGMTRASALGCFAFHWIAFAATLAVLACVIAFVEGNYIVEEFDWVFQEFDRNAVLATLVVGGNILAIEGGMVLLGVLLAAWGARDEPLGKSLGFGIRRVWLCSTFGIVPILVIGGAVGGIHRWHGARLERIMLNPPALPDDVYQEHLDCPDDAEVQARYQKEQAEFHEKRWDYVEAYQRAHQLFFRYKDELIALAVLGSIFLVGWSLLRVVAAPRPSRAPPQDPMCEWCGYNLTTIPMDSRCPECGRSVIGSLGDPVRPGTRWDRRKELRITHPWFETMGGVVFDAPRFGRSIQLTTGKTAHRWFLLRSLVFIGILAYAGVIGVDLWETSSWVNRSLEKKLFVVLLVGPIMATAAVVGNLLLTLAAAVLASLHYWRLGRRNLLPAAMQMASYGSGFLVLWSLVICATVAALFFLQEYHYLGALERLTGLRRDAIGSIVFLLPNGICLMVYLRIVFAGTGSARYANR